VPGTGDVTLDANTAAAEAVKDLKTAAADTAKDTPREAPQATASHAMAPDAVTAERPTAGIAATPGSVTATSIKAPTISPIERIGTTTVAPTAGAQATDATAAQLNTAAQNEIRQRQMGLLGSLEGTVAGTAGPSLAEIQGRKAAEDAASQQLGLVAMNHGRGVGGALRTASGNIAKIQSDAAANAAMLRAKEKTDAQGQLLSALEGTRGQDIGIAGKEADLSQAVNLQNAAQHTNVAISNADREQARAMKDADLEAAAKAGNAAAQNELNRRQAELNLTADTTNSEQKLKADQGNQDTATKVNISNAGNETTTSIAGASEANKVNLANAENDLRVSLANADNDTKTALANAGFTLQGRQIDDERNVAAVKAYLEAQQQYITSADQTAKNKLARDQLDEAIKAGDREMVMRIIGSILSAGAVVGAAASDRRMKKDIVDLYSDDRGKTGKKPLIDHYDGPDEVGAMLDAIKPVKFKYKDPKAEGAAPGERYGVIAQDLEKTPMGKSIVVDMPDGHKGIDTAQAVGVLLAAMARMRQQGKRAT